MEWVETTAKSLDDAKNAALDQLGVAADEAEFEVLEEPKPGLFGRTRGEARVRARVKPAQVRPKNDRRRKSSKSRSSKSSGSSNDNAATVTADRDEGRSDDDASGEETSPAPTGDTAAAETSSDRQPRGNGTRSKNQRSKKKQENTMNDSNESEVSPQEVGDAAVAFMDGLVEAFGCDATADLSIDDTELELNVSGEGLGLLVGPGGRTLNAIQDLARVSSQRRLGDHETRLRIDVAGYRLRRNEALARFAADVAGQVRESGAARSLEPMSSADRKVIHDALNEESGVSSRSEGDDPNRRVVVVPD